MTADLAAWLLADDGPIAEDEAWARAACGRPSEVPPVDGGEHWQWECGNDHVVTPDPTVGEHLVCPVCGSYDVSLRSVELYPTDNVGPLPTFAVPYAQEMPTTVAGHLVRWDPSRVLAECAAKRAIVERHRSHTSRDLYQTAVPRDHPGYRGEERHRYCATLLDVARLYQARPGWREEWGT